MVSREHLTAETVEALVEMLADDGAAAPGSVAPEHVEQLRQASDRGDARDVAHAHRRGEAPPDLGGRP